MYENLLFYIISNNSIAIVLVILVSVKCCLGAFHGISLIVNDIEHIFMSLLTILIATFGKYLFKSFAHFELVWLYLD